MAARRVVDPRDVAMTLPSTSLTVLGGGTGTPKLLWGLSPPECDALTVVANTGDDVEFGDLFVSPDVDACLFAGAGRIDTDTWWGLASDSTATADALATYADAVGLESTPRFRPPEDQTSGRRLSQWRRFEPVAEFMTFGDEDRAIHRARAAALDAGHSLTDITRSLGDALGCPFEVLPMSDDPVATLVETPAGVMHFQEYWVANRGDVSLEGVRFRGNESARPTDAVLSALGSGPVVIGPSNPVTSIGPMLALPEVKEALASAPVIAVSPFLGDDAFSGPATALQTAVGHPPGTAGLEAAYPFLDAAILDAADEVDLSVPTVHTDIRIDQPADARRIWRAVGEAIDRVS